MHLHRIFYSLLTAALTFGAITAVADRSDELIIGSEIEFGNNEMVKMTSPRGIWNMTRQDWKSLLHERYIYPGSIETKYVEKFAAAVRQACGSDCTVQQVNGKFNTPDSYEVRFKNGFWFQITRDASVVEILGYRSLAEWKANEALAQKYIFDIAKAVGLTPGGSGSRFSVGASHMNIGVWEAFHGDGQRFLRYFVDRANAPEFSMGLFLKDYINAPPMTKLKPAQRQALSQIVSQVEADPTQFTPADVSKLIMDQVYTSSPYIGTEPGHYQSFGVKSVVKSSGPDHDRPMEHRDQRVQESMAQFNLTAELFAKRILFLNQQVDPIYYLEKEASSFSDQELVSRFYIYITEMGEDCSNYQTLLPIRLRKVQPDTFVRGIVDWSRPDLTYQVIVKWIPDLVNSAFLRGRFIQALAAAPQETGNQASDLIQKVHEQLITRQMPLGKQDLIRKMLVLLDQTPRWRGTAVIPFSLAPRCHAVFVN